MKIDFNFKEVLKMALRSSALIYFRCLMIVKKKFSYIYPTFLKQKERHAAGYHLQYGNESISLPIIVVLLNFIFYLRTY